MHDKDPYRKKYLVMKRKLRLLVYEQEAFTDELKTSQRNLLKVVRDRSFLLDRMCEHEDKTGPSKDADSSADSEVTDSSDEEEGAHVSAVSRTKEKLSVRSFDHKKESYKNQPRISTKSRYSRNDCVSSSKICDKRGNISFSSLPVPVNSGADALDPRLISDYCFTSNISPPGRIIEMNTDNFVRPGPIARRAGEAVPSFSRPDVQRCAAIALLMPVTSQFPDDIFADDTPDVER